jgi:hypothetical protein
VQDFFAFRQHLYALESGAFMRQAHGLDSLETLQYFVFHLFDASRHIAHQFASDSGGSDINFFDHLIDETPLWRNSEASQRRTSLEVVDADGGMRVDDADGDTDDTAAATAALRNMQPLASTRDDALNSMLQARVPGALRLAAAATIASLVVYVRAWRAAIGPFGIWAPLTALFVVDRSMGSSVRKSLMRVQGTGIVRIDMCCA